MLPVDEYVSALYPELLLSTSYDVYIDIATSQTSTSFFGAQYNYAVALRACHNYYIDNGRVGSDGGAVTNRTEGKTSMSYWNTIPKDVRTTLGLSSFGQRLQGLITQQGGKASITNSEIL